jgi:hypothetical protein
MPRGFSPGIAIELLDEVADISDGFLGPGLRSRASIQKSPLSRGSPQGFPGRDVALVFLANVELAILKVLFAIPVDASVLTPRA